MENREIDRLIAEKVMGWEVGEFPNINVIEAYSPHGVLQISDDWSPSTDIQDAWYVVEELDYDIKVTKYKSHVYQCHIFIPNNVQMVIAETAPMAICLAALKSVGIEV